MKNNVVWIFQTFGFLAGFRYLWHSLILRTNRLTEWEPLPLKFEDLTDEQAEQVAHGFGIFQWESRDHLNRVWHNFEKTLN